MKKAPYPNGEDYVRFEMPPDEEGNIEVWYVHANFLTSNWTCIYGNGCPGLFQVNENRYHDDIGCCRHGCWFADGEDWDSTAALVEELTDQDWDEDKRKVAEKKGWGILYSRDDSKEHINARTRVVDHGCIFHNRNTGSVGSLGKTGCAFHHLGVRTGRDHVQVMPQVCWQLPLKYEYSDELDAHLIHPWDIDAWGGGEPYQERDDMCWWCVDSPEAYVGSKPVYLEMEHELRELMDDAVYEQMVKVLSARGPVAPMPGSVRNEGRPLLPLLVGNREPYRQPSATSTPAVIEKMKENNNG